MGNYVKPNIIDKFSGLKVRIWRYFEEEIGNQDGPFVIEQGELADRFNVSRTAVINALKVFASANLLEKVSSGKGRGNHSKYRLLWTFKTKSEIKCNPFTRESSKPQEKDLSNGSFYRYHAMKFREAVESSSLADHAYKIVGKILKFLSDKPRDLYKSWLTHLKRWLNGSPREKTLTDFFIYFNKGLMSIWRSQKELEQSEKLLEDIGGQKKKARESWKGDPPKLKEFGYDFEKYQKALEKWEEKKPKN